jgi:hypothetical protein
MEVNDAAAEPALAQELGLCAHIVGSARLPPTTEIGMLCRPLV